MSPTTEGRATFFVVGLTLQGLVKWHLLDATLTQADAEKAALKLSEKFRDIQILQATSKVIIERVVTRTIQRTGAIYRPEHDDPTGPQPTIFPTFEGYKLTAPPTVEKLDE